MINLPHITPRTSFITEIISSIRALPALPSAYSFVLRGCVPHPAHRPLCREGRIRIAHDNAADKKKKNPVATSTAPMPFLKGQLLLEASRNRSLLTNTAITDPETSTARTYVVALMLLIAIKCTFIVN